MDSNENRRKSKRLNEKCINSQEINTKISVKKTKIKNKSNNKCLKLKENETNVRKSSRNCEKRLNGMIEAIPERKYGLRRLAPINWKERLDTRHIITENKSIDNKTVDKTKAKHYSKNEDKTTTKIKEKKIKSINNKINGKISSKVDNKLSYESIILINNKRNKRRKTNYKTTDKCCEQSIDKTNQIKCVERLDNQIDVQVIDSTQESSDLCQTNVNIEQQIPESEVQENTEELSDNISYIQYLDKCSDIEPKAPSLSVNVIINFIETKIQNQSKECKEIGFRQKA